MNLKTRTDNEMDKIEIPTTITVWYKNIPLLTNVITVAAMILTNYFGVSVPAELQAGILAIINILIQTPNMASTSEKAVSRNRTAKAKMIKNS